MPDQSTGGLAAYTRRFDKAIYMCKISLKFVSPRKRVS